MKRNYQDKLFFLQNLAGTNDLLKMRKPNDWYCSLPGEVVYQNISTSTFGNGGTPQAAVNAAWEIFTNLPENQYIRTNSGKIIKWCKEFGTVSVSYECVYKHV